MEALNIEFIARDSLKFLTAMMDSGETIHPLSSLPFSKEIIKNAILEYVKSAQEKSELSENELGVIRIYYGSLSNFVSDEQAKLASLVNEELEKIGPNDEIAIKNWLSNPANSEKDKETIEIMTQTVADREKLRQEFDAVIVKK